MQLYALKGAQSLLASEAKKEEVYLCPECQAPLKMRGGPSRQAHFYHLRHTKPCHQHSKSEEHLALQIKLFRLIKAGNASMELAFPEIHRIADVAWPEKKVIFEIQCSFISLEEARKRCTDYQSLGYTVIWILHDKRFNKRALSAAELYLRSQGAYFTNVNKISQGTIYDQFEVIQAHRRLFKGPRLPCDPTALSLLPRVEAPDLPFPAIALQRLKEWKYCVKGDLLHLLLHDPLPQNTAKQLLAFELGWAQRYARVKQARLPVATLLVKSYTALLQLLLKKISAVDYTRK